MKTRILCGTIVVAVSAFSAHGAFDVRDFGAKGDKHVEGFTYTNTRFDTP